MTQIRRMRTILAWLLTFAAASVAAADNRADVLVVCPVEFRAALAPWVSYREGQGHALRIIESTQTASELRTIIQRVAGENQLHNIVLIGDVRHARGDISF